MLLNFGDDADMRFARRLVSTLLSTVTNDDAGLLSAPASVVGAQEEGNLVFAAVVGGQFSDAQRNHISAAGPHPGQVLSGTALRRWTK